MTSAQQESSVNQSQQPVLSDVEKAISQLDSYGLQIDGWQHNFKRKENIYDEFVIKHELRVKELEAEIFNLQRTISRLLGDFEGVSNTERTNSMEAKKSQLLDNRQAMKQEITIPIDEFTALGMAGENTISNASNDKEAIQEALSIAFYKNLGVEVQSNTEVSGHTMKLVSYTKPSVINFVYNEDSDDFVNAQKIWDYISP